MGSSILQLSRSQRLALEYIRSFDNISRTEISTLTGLTAGALSRLIRELLDMRLILEGPRQPTPRGQPRQSLLLNKDAVWSIGVSFSVYEVEVVAIDFSGTIIAAEQAPISDKGAAAILDLCAELIGKHIDAQSHRNLSPCGIGFAMPGYFLAGDQHQINAFSSLAPLANVNLATLDALFGYPTWIENNSSAAALAEYYARPDRTARSISLINIGYGFSAGYVIAGKLYRGRGGNAGEIGQFYPRGTLRPSVLDLVQECEKHGIAINATSDLAELSNAPSDILISWATRAAEQLSHVIQMLDFIVAPDDLVVGGQLPPTLLAMLYDRIELKRAGVPLRVSSLAPHGAAHGAAYLPLYHLFSSMS